MFWKEILVKGGLGNQLFCLLQAYRLKCSFEDSEVALNITGYSINKSRLDRSFLLNKLYPEISDEFHLVSNKSSIFNFFLAKVFEKFFAKSCKKRIYGDKVFKLRLWFKSYLYSGYFQKIDNTQLDLKALKILKRKLFPFISALEKNNYLAIHLRRGDYLNKKHSIHGIIQEKYLLSEAKRLLKKCYFEGITIFTDSPELVDLLMYKKIHKNIILDSGGEPTEVLKRMANHKGIIASNSTFSLWAGILGNVEYFSIPYFWMKNQKSSLLGLKHINRYKCSI